MDRTNQALAEAERARAQVTSILERITDPFMALDTEWRYTFVNEKAAQIFGRTRDELIGKCIWTEFPARRGQAFYEVVHDAMETQQSATLQEYYPDTDRWFQHHVYPSKDGLSVFIQDITAHKHTETSLNEHEARLRLATTAANVGLWEWELHSNRVFFSSEWKRQLGYEDHEILNDFAEWETRLHPDDLERVKAKARHYVQQPYPNYSNEFRMRHKDGSYRWILAQAALLTDEQGNPSHMLGSHVDITERKRTEEELRVSEERYRLLIEQSPYAIGVHQDGKIVFANASALRLYGAECADQLIGTTIQDIVHPETWDAARARIARMLQGATGLYPTEDRYLRLDGSEVTVEVTATPFMLDGRPAIQVIALDITARKRAEEALRQSEGRFRRALENIPDVVILYDTDLKIQYINEATLTITGRAPSDFIGKRDEDVMPPQVYETYMPTLKEALRTKKVCSVDTEILIPNQEPQYVSIDCVPLLDGTGEVIELLGITHNLTHLRQAERAIQESEERYRSIVTSIPGGLLSILDRDLKFVISTGEELVRLGLSNQERIGRSIHDVMPPEAAQIVESACKNVLLGETVQFESAYGGNHYLVRAVPLRDANGDTTHVLMLSINITERKQAEEQLRVSRKHIQQNLERLQRAEEDAGLGSWEFGTDPGQSWWSPQMYRLHGFDPANGIPDYAAYLESIHPEDRASVQDAVAQMVHQQEPLPQFFRSNPEHGPLRYFSSNTRGQMNATGKLIKFTGTLLDITERVEAEEEVRRSETRYRQLFDEAPVLFIEVDFSALKHELDQRLAGEIEDLHTYLAAHLDDMMEHVQNVRFCDVNNLVLQQYGAPDKQAVLEGMQQATLTSVHDPQIRSDTLRMLIAMAKGKIQDEQEQTTRTIAGKRRHFRRVWSVLPGYEADYSRVLVTMIDTTQRIEAEEAAHVYAQQMGLLSEITQAALEAPSLQVMLQTLADRLGELFDADSCFITQWDEGAQRALPSAASGRLRDSYPSIVLPENAQTVTASVLEVGRPLAIADVHNTPHISRSIAGQFDAQSMLALPLMAGDQHLGAALLEYTTPHQFTEEEIGRARQAAAQLSLAVAKGRLVEQAQRDARELHMLSGKLMSLQEDERRELARELHDEIGQVLTAVKTNLMALQLAPDSDTAGRRLQTSIDVVVRALQQVRSLALELRPSLLDDFGLGPALAWYIEQLVERCGLAVSSEVDLPADTLPAALAITCFRLVQAALTNIERHAQATEAQVIVRQLPARTGTAQELELIVRDNGQGFDVSSILANAAYGASMGLMGMRERARLSGGMFAVTSKPGQGTEIRARLPILRTIREQNAS